MLKLPRLTAYPKECPGGGYIYIDPDRKFIHIYGTSLGYGTADHKLAASIIGKVYTDYTITAATADEWMPEDKYDGKYAPIWYPWELDKDGNVKNKYLGEQ